MMKLQAFRSLTLTILLLVVGGCANRHVIPAHIQKLPYVFSILPSEEWKILDRSGKDLSLSYPRDFIGEPGEAECFRYKKTDYKMPLVSKMEELSKVKPLVVQGPCLRLPISDTVKKDICCFSMVELPSGKLFISGGEAVDEDVPADSLKATWLFNPDTRKAVLGPDLHFCRSRHCTTLLQDGRVLITGGRYHETIQQSAEIYDPETGGISDVGLMCLPREGHRAVLFSKGNVLIVGGNTDERYADASQNLTSTAEVFDTEKKHFSLVGKLRIARSSPLVVAYGANQAVVAGGTYGAVNGQGKWVWEAEIFTEPGKCKADSQSE